MTACIVYDLTDVRACDDRLPTRDDVLYRLQHAEMKDCPARAVCIEYSGTSGTFAHITAKQ